ncbi:MAG: hypothetical protein RLZZ385_893 [Pseudomonadota bacterium]|jgi:hypothetical protein
MNRWKAFGIHLGISVAVFAALMAVIIYFWFPGILFSIDGGWNGLKIIMGVDVVLGPLLTLIVFKPGKKGLKFDLACIAVVQISCLLAGTWIVHGARPLAVLLAYDTVYSLGAKEFELYGKDPALLEAFPGPYPKLLYSELPENDISADIINVRSQFIGDPLFIQTERYRAMPDDVEPVFRRVASVRATAQTLVGEEAIGVEGDGCLLSYFVSAYTNGLVCFDGESRKLTRFIPM